MFPYRSRSTKDKKYEEEMENELRYMPDTRRVLVDAEMREDSKVVQVTLLYFQEKDVAEALGCLESRLLINQPQTNQSN